MANWNFAQENKIEKLFNRTTKINLIELKWVPNILTLSSGKKCWCEKIFNQLQNQKITSSWMYSLFLFTFFRCCCKCQWMWYKLLSNITYQLTNKIEAKHFCWNLFFDTRRFRKTLSFLLRVLYVHLTESKWYKFKSTIWQACIRSYFCVQNYNKNGL